MPFKKVFGDDDMSVEDASTPEEPREDDEDHDDEDPLPSRDDE